MSGVYVIAANWPFDTLSLAGKLSWMLKLGDDYAHLGILFEAPTAEEWALLEQRQSRVWRASEPFPSRPPPRITWDVIVKTWRPHFQSHPGQYYKDAKPQLHAMWALQIDAAERATLFYYCVKLSEEAPAQNLCVRFDTFFGCLPWRCCYAECCTGTGAGPSTCVSLVLRAIAMLRDDDAQYSDEATFRALGIVRYECCAPSPVTHFTPRQALLALDEAGWIRMEHPLLLGVPSPRVPLLAITDNS